MWNNALRLQYCKKEKPFTTALCTESVLEILLFAISLFSFSFKETPAKSSDDRKFERGRSLKGEEGGEETYRRGPNFWPPIVVENIWRRPSVAILGQFRWSRLCNEIFSKWSVERSSVWKRSEFDEFMQMFGSEQSKNDTKMTQGRLAQNFGRSIRRLGWRWIKRMLRDPDNLVKLWILKKRRLVSSLCYSCLPFNMVSVIYTASFVSIKYNLFAIQTTGKSSIAMCQPLAYETPDLISRMHQVMIYWGSSQDEVVTRYTLDNLGRWVGHLISHIFVILLKVRKNWSTF